MTEKISSVVSRLKIDEPLKDHTTFRIGGKCRYFAEVEDEDALCRVWNLLRQAHLPLLVLGNGSNVLASDLGFEGMVVRLAGDLAGHAFEGEKLTAGAGARLPGLVSHCAQRELAGLEHLAGVPGTVGGALIGNAGTQDGGIGDLVEEVRVLSPGGKIEKRGKGELCFEYRGSNLENTIILEAVLRLKKKGKNDILNKINVLMARRAERQPVGAWCAGSVFKNPPHESAGRLIEACGLKGLQFGGARISEKHANFIVNTGAAKASDVLALISIARQKVKTQFNIDLELEIKIIGEKYH